MSLVPPALCCVIFLGMLCTVLGGWAMHENGAYVRTCYHCLVGKFRSHTANVVWSQTL